MSIDIDFQSFFPKAFQIKSIEEYPHTLLFHLESTSESALCPNCCSLSLSTHKKRHRKNIYDLPILDKAVVLNITLKEYYCSECYTYFAENPDGFLQKRKSITARCERYLSELKHSLNGGISDTLKIAEYSHLPLNRGVVRYAPVNISISDSDKLWIQNFVRQHYPNATADKKNFSLSLASEIVQKIHNNCEKSLHPNLVTLSTYELTCIIAEDKENGTLNEEREI